MPLRPDGRGFAGRSSGHALTNSAKASDYTRNYTEFVLVTSINVDCNISAFEDYLVDFLRNFRLENPLNVRRRDINKDNFQVVFDWFLFLSSEGTAARVPAHGRFK